MKSNAVCAVILITLFAGIYGPLRFMAPFVPALYLLPGVDCEVAFVVIVHGFVILPLIGLISFVIAILHKQLMVPLALPLPAFIYAALSELVFGLFLTFNRLPTWIQGALKGGEIFMTVLFFVAYMSTIFVVIHKVRNERIRRPNNNVEK